MDGDEIDGGCGEGSSRGRWSSSPAVVPPAVAVWSGQI